MIRAPFAVLALLCAFLLTGVNGLPGPARAQERDTLTIGMTQFPSTLNPHIDAMLAKTYVLAMTRRPITIYNADWELVCLLCTELPTIENGRAVPERTPDGEEGIAIRVTLRDDARWGDGTPVTTRDVVFTWQVGKHPESGFSNIEPWRRILSIDVIDEHTFVMHVDRITFRYNDMSGFDLLPAHVEAAAFENPADYRRQTLFDRDPTNPALYFGPYRITEFEVNSHVVLERNETWYGETPHFRRIVVRVIPNTAALEANLLSGGIDYIAGELGLTLDQALGFEERLPEQYDIVYKAGLIYEHIDLNLDNPILADRRVREALILGIDRQLLTEQLFQGRQPVAHSMVNPLDRIAAHDDLPEYEHDPARANALLDEAGWTERHGGIRHNADGERLQLTLMTTAGNRSRELVQQVLQSMWRQIGIDVRIQNEPARVFFGRTVTQRRFPAMAMYAWLSSPESVPRTTLHSDQIPTEANGWSGQNYPGYRNPEMDALIDRIERELDPDARRALWREIQLLYVRDLPVLPLYFRANPYVMPSWLKGVRPTGHQYPSTYWVEEWRAAE